MTKPLKRKQQQKAGKRGRYFKNGEEKKGLQKKKS